jgi:dTMP kinase
MRGRFITLEGLDGAGKSTHLACIVATLEARGLAVRATREPGGTPVGEALRALLLDRDQTFHPETETLLVFAARREHLDKVIVPALTAGTWVVCDRFTDASYAYQSAGSGVDWGKVARLEAWTHGDLHPDLTLYFDVSPEVGRARSGSARIADRYEQERSAFHERVRAGYLRRAREQPERVRVIAADRTLAEVKKELKELVTSYCIRWEARD